MSSRLPDLGPRGEGWVAIQGVLFVLIFLAGDLGPAWAAPIRLPIAGAGLAIIAAGGLLALRGVVDLRESLTAFPRPRDGSRLIERGAYRLVRHPIYGGLVLGALGWGLATASPASIGGGLILAAFFDLKSRREEEWLTERYPAYAAYRARTRRMIPWLY